jgi:hypothetical protein
VLPGGVCWMLMRGDDVLEIEARITLESDDNQQIYMMWKAFASAAPDWRKGSSTALINCFVNFGFGGAAARGAGESPR